VTTVDSTGQCPCVTVFLQATNQHGERTAEGTAEILLDDYGRLKRPGVA
jgi:hypothetical protein